MSINAKQLALRVLVQGFPASLKYVQQDCATIFMLHRFHDPSRGIVGIDPAHVRQGLKYLVRHGYELLSLTDMFDRLAAGGSSPRGAVAFTIDDGYIDHATVAAPLFAEFNCSVTTFVTSGFLDGTLWFWWDQIEYVFQATTLQHVQVQLDSKELTYQWTTPAERLMAQTAFTTACKFVSDVEKWNGVALLAEAAKVDIPVTPPAHCAPMTWDQLRACEDSGMRFGPHTVTHPVLSRASDDASRHEIDESWRRLCAEARHPVPIFCYPNGQREDFSDREISALQRLGFRGAVVGKPGYANAKTFQRSAENPFLVQRFPFPDELPHLIQCVNGMERFKELLRRSA